MIYIGNKFCEYLVKRRNEILRPYLEGEILDLGCGPAWVINILKDPSKYTGIELKEKVEALKKAFPSANFYARDLEKEGINLNKKWDRILLIAVIEHIPEMDSLFSEISKYLRSNGEILITSPTKRGDKIHTLLSYIGLTSKHAVEEHCNIVNFKIMQKELAKFNLEIKDYQKFEFGCNQFFVIGWKK